jgi:nitrite reductase (NADH) small subunit
VEQVVARLSRLAGDAGTVVDVRGESVALFRAADAVVAYRNVCPHRGGPVGEGLVAGGIVTCPWHGNRFEIASGRCVSDPALGSLRPVQARVDGDDVLVEP